MDTEPLGALLHDRRESDIYYVLSREQLEKLATDAGAAGGKCAVDGFTSLIGTSVIRKISLLVGAAVAVATAWLSGMVHFGAGK